MPHDIKAVIERGMCVGCGACSLATGGAIPVTLGPYRVYQADVSDASEETLAVASRVCPFSDDSPSEDVIGPPTDDGRRLPHDARLGRVGRVLVGRRTDEAQLLKSSSGGMTSWLLDALFQDGRIDGVVHVGQSNHGDELFVQGVSHAASEADTKRKSIYYATTLVNAINEIRGDGKRYALVGVPCYITAARHVASEDAVLAEQLAYYIGIVCGHLKSQFFAESLARQLAVPPDELAEVDFRIKDPDAPANDYLFGARAAGAETMRTAKTQELFGGNWGIGAFQPEACNFCDDIFAETADIALGDAWLPEFERDWRGTNIVVTRHPELDSLLDDGQEAGELDFRECEVDDAVRSQGGNFRHRRDGLAVRLADDIDEGLSVPSKRVQPDRDHVSKKRLALIRQRRKMSAMSLRLFHAARAANDLDLYLQPMRKEFKRYRKIDRPFVKRLRGRISRSLHRRRA